MTLARSRNAVLASLLIALVALTGCKNTRENDAGREGLPDQVGHIDYNVFLTRELNLKDVEDAGYYRGPEAPPGYALYGVFVQACNEHRDANAPHWMAASKFVIEDTEGKHFTPIPLPASNIWAYRPRPLKQRACIPKNGSLPAAGPTNGSLLIFKLPLTTLENRPLNLLITSPPAADGKTETGRIELDV